MRNAAAHIDDDFDLVEPPRKRKPARSATNKRQKAKRLRFNFDMMKVARYGGIVITAVVAIGIVVNALMMQKGRHPAPLFGKSIALGAPPPAPAVKAKTVEPTPRPPVVSDTAKAAPPPAPPVKEAGKIDDGNRADPIAKLLHEHAAPSDKPPSKTVIGAQRALVKLGFVLRPNGHFGPQTKKAVEAFEKERHLPVKGELSRRVVKILAAESGMKIEQ